MSVGQCLALRPTVLGLVVAGGFGLLASGVVVRRPRTGAFAPLVVAAVIAVLSLAAARHGLGFPASRPLLAALLTVPPGVAVTITTVELGSDELAASADWWAWVAGHLLMYAAGIVVAGELGGLLDRAALPDQHADILGGGPPWLGMFVFVVASSLYFRPPRTWGRGSDDGGTV